MSTKLFLTVDLVPASCDDATAIAALDHGGGPNAWRDFPDGVFLLEYLDDRMKQSQHFAFDHSTHTVFGTGAGEVHLFLFTDGGVGRLRAMFDPWNPCRRLALCLGTMAQLFDLCAVMPERGVIRDNRDFETFGRAILQHVAAQSTARH